MSRLRGKKEATLRRKSNMNKIWGEESSGHGQWLVFWGENVAGPLHTSWRDSLVLLSPSLLLLCLSVSFPPSLSLPIDPLDSDVNLFTS